MTTPSIITRVIVAVRLLAFGIFSIKTIGVGVDALFKAKTLEKSAPVAIRGKDLVFGLVRLLCKSLKKRATCFSKEAHTIISDSVLRRIAC